MIKERWGSKAKSKLKRLHRGLAGRENCHRERSNHLHWQHCCHQPRCHHHYCHQHHRHQHRCHHHHLPHPNHHEVVATTKGEGQRKERKRERAQAGKGLWLTLEKGSGWHWLTLWNVPGSLFQVTMSVLAIQALIVIKGLLSLSAKLDTLATFFVFFSMDTWHLSNVFSSFFRRTTLTAFLSFEVTRLLNFEQISNWHQFFLPLGLTPMSHSSDGICPFLLFTRHFTKCLLAIGMDCFIEDVIYVTWCQK